jgi:hypothetical protein
MKCCFPLFLLFVLLLVGCANQQLPQGGPVDTTPPEIISIYPDSNAQNYNDSKIIIEFDRYVDERITEESIFISPYIGTLEFNWSGTELEISFSEKLRQNTTYVVNIGTDVKDRFRGQTRMAKAYTLAFSTGPDIDRGGIEGFVLPMKNGTTASGVMIFAYQLDALNPDTLNPITAKPDFITQAGENGNFFLHHIKFGSYRIFAIRDEYRNLVYDRETDEYGVPSGIINVTSVDTLVTGVLMKLAKEDTTGPRLVKVIAQDRNHVFAEFSETINPASIKLPLVSIIDTLDPKPLELLTVYPSAVNQTSLVVVTQAQDSNKTYKFSIQGVVDSVGNKINPFANSFIFNGSPKVDTLSLQLVSVSVKDSAQYVDIQPVFTLTFSDALMKTNSLDWVQILDNKNLQILIEKKRVSDIMISVSPVKELMSQTWYTLRTELQGVNGWNGRACRDFTKSWRFETLDIEDFSSIEGKVSDVNKADTKGNLYVTALQIGEKTPRRYTVAADATGNFIIPKVEEGFYVLQAFRDRNNNSEYDYGMPFPFTYSERLSAFSDTLKVRARWPLEGVKILMK